MATSKGDSCSVGGLDEVIKPSLTVDSAKELAEELYNFTIESVKQLDSYDDQNFYLVVKGMEDKKQEYTLKVVNTKDSLDKAVQEAQTQLLLFLHTNGIQCPKPVKLPSGDYMTLENIKGNKGTHSHMVRLLTYIPGELYKTAEMTPELCYQAGRHIASIDSTLKDFYHKGFERPDFLWSLEMVPEVEKYVHVFEEKEKKDILHSVLKAFKDKVITSYPELRKSTIHGDYNEGNILIKEVNSNLINGADKTATNSAKYEICGILDVGDVTYSYCMFDAAIALMYTMLISRTPIESGGHMLAGYQSVFPLTDLEKELLYYCITARIAQSVTYGMYTYTLHPHNNYLLNTQEDGWRVLKYLWGMQNKDILKQWDEINKSYSS